MATCRSIVNSALRKIGVLAAGREARPTDFTDALSSLQSLYFSLIDGGAFGRLADVVPLGTTYTTNGNERIFRQTSDVLSVTLPELIAAEQIDSYNDGWSNSRSLGTVITISTQGNATVVDVAPAQPVGYVTPPRDCSVVSIIDAFSGTTATYIYDGSIKQWQPIDDLAIDGNAPISSRNADGLSSLLAMQIVDEFGGDAPQATARSAAQFQASLATRFSQPREEACGVYC